MMQLVVFHLLLLLLIPILWHEMKQESLQWPKPAGAEAQGSPLTGVEQKYYDTVFSYSMQNVAEGQSYPWQVGKSSGDISAGPAFVSPSHSFCRAYSEHYIINGTQGASSGYACRRAEDGDTPSWCRLRPGQALTCALEQRGFMDEMEHLLR